MSRVRWMMVAGFALIAVGSTAGRSQAADQKSEGHHRGHGGAGFMALGKLELLRNEKIQKELALTDEQRDSLHKFAEELREEIGKGRGQEQKLSPDERRTQMAAVFAQRQKDIQKKLDDVLTTAQRQRLGELELQLRGPAALYQADVADSLALTDDQKKKLEDLKTEQAKQFRDMMRDAFHGGDRDKVREQVQKARKDAHDAVLAVLTTEQRDKFEKMQGPKFEFDPALLALFRGGFGEHGHHGPGGPPGSGPAGNGHPPDKKPDADTKSADAKASADSK